MHTAKEEVDTEVGDDDREEGKDHVKMKPFRFAQNATPRKNQIHLFFARLKRIFSHLIIYYFLKKR